ncbi:MAG TPA: metal-sulfur cluster assembly factor [Gemmatimonadaceae bacterium]|jgi:metal-sulfur cluster biosynthetic enzyme
MSDEIEQDANSENTANDASNAAAPNEPGNAASPADVITSDIAKLALRKVKDPELGLNIVDLGLVYEISVDPSNNIHVDMTLTSPGCPAGPQIMTDVERVLQGLPGVGEVELNLVWSPYWTPERIEPRVRAYMGL